MENTMQITPKSNCKKSKFYLSIIAANVMLLSGQHAAHAQGQGLEEVIVTAERRSESLQDTPMSVTAFTGDMVGQGGITNIADIAVQTPNFKLTTFNISEPQLYSVCIYTPFQNK